MAESWVASGYQTGSQVPSITRRSAVAELAAAVAAAAVSPGALAQGAKELRVFAAADLIPVMPVLAQLYRKRAGVQLKVTTGASGSLVTQIQNGAPADIFLGADYVFPEKLVAADLTTARAPTPYARGTLVLFALANSPLQPVTLERLRDPRAEKVAIANQEHAPYGRAAVAALTHMGYLPAISGKLVTAENVAQAGQFVLSGNAQLGLISLTLAESAAFKQAGTYLRVPASQYLEIRQCAVVLKKGNTSAAQAFLDWLSSAEIQPNLPNVGLRPAQ